MRVGNLRALRQKVPSPRVCFGAIKSSGSGQALALGLLSFTRFCPGFRV